MAKMAVFTAGIIASPANNAVLADTGALDAGGHNFSLIVSTTVALQATLQWRDAANAATLYEHTFLVGANSSFYVPPIMPGYIEQGQRFRVIARAAVTGSVQVSLVLDG